MTTPTAMVAPHTPDLDERKRAARAEAIARRATCGDPQRAGEALAAGFLSACPPPPGAIVAGTWPIGTEIDPRPLLSALTQRGHPLVLPVTPRRGTPLQFRGWRWGDPLAPGPLGTRHPIGGDAIQPEWILVPLLAFDRAGRRLGYGGGYYDRTLAALPGTVAIGCAFAGQEIPQVPAGPHDRRLSHIATELGMITCIPAA